MLRNLRIAATLVLVTGLSACGWSMTDGIQEIAAVDLAPRDFITGLYRAERLDSSTFGKHYDELYGIQPQSDGALSIRNVWHDGSGKPGAENEFAYLIKTQNDSEALLLRDPAPDASSEVMLLRRLSDKSYDVYQFRFAEEILDYDPEIAKQATARHLPACAKAQEARDRTGKDDSELGKLCELELESNPEAMTAAYEEISPGFARLRQTFADVGLNLGPGEILGSTITTGGTVTSSVLRQVWADPRVKAAIVLEDKPVAHLTPSSASEDRARIAASDAVAVAPKYVVAKHPSARFSRPGSRVALIVANAAYNKASLSNPETDADIIAPALMHMGFDVTVKKNLDVDGFDAAVAAFEFKAEKADIALFYFAGHGFAMADNGEMRNYLVATSADVTLAEERSIKRHSLALDEIVAQLSGQASTALVFVDACRNVPGARGGAARGLAPVAGLAASNVFVGLSTLPGKFALDGQAGDGSPFARAFAEEMAQPGTRIDDAFTRIRLDVEKETNYAQSPDVGRYALSTPLVLVPVN